ncbi:MAG: hypothetical protein ACRC1T_11895 [Clostridium chrysemydis]|uniref:hypothetical protein n=1 Tax=Clostridium chrysemydis TaxID=2665504 RepID=UPI003F2F99FD
MEDILSIKTIENIPIEIRCLKNTTSLLEGSRYMLNIKDTGEEHLAEWKVFSALSLLFSIKEVIIKDFKKYKMQNQWIKSIWNDNINKDSLIKILREIRNYNIHIELTKHDIKNQHIQLGTGNNKITGILEKEIFFNEINMENLSQLNNVRRYKNISHEEIKWFNQQSSIWSVANLFQVAREVFYKNILGFIKENDIN